MINSHMNLELAEERRRQLLESAARDRYAGTLRDGRRRRLTSWVNRTFRGAFR